MIGFSPKLHHALAFASKYHEGQRRKARNVEYIVHPFEVTLILARYGCPEVVLIGGLLHDVVEDCCATNVDVEVMMQKIEVKFGSQVLSIVMGVTELKRDSRDEKIETAIRRRMYLDHIMNVSEESHWVCAADKVANGNDLLTALMHAKDRNAVWNAFSGGREAVVVWYRAVHTHLLRAGFKGAIMEELDNVASRLESAAITHDADIPRLEP